MAYHFLDTSAVLNGALSQYNDIYISPLVLTELEHIKSSSTKDDQIKFQARQAVRTIINNNNINYFFPPHKSVEKLLKKYNFLSDIVDHQLLCEAALLSIEKKQMIEFITSDGALYLFASQIPGLTSIFYEQKKKIQDSEYCGWGKYFPNDDQLNLLYSDPKMNILNCKINEFAEIFVDGDLKDVLFWNGTEYTNLKYKPIKNLYTGETVKPRNLEQKMAFHLLQNQNIKVKLLTSAWGGGKTMLAINYALEQVGHGIYSKIVFVRNNIIAAGTNDIGYLPGDVRDKLSIFTRCIADHVGGEEELERLMDEGIIEAIPLSHIRGRSIKDSIVLCDECENMDDKLTTLLLSRIEENSEIIFCGDVAQIDKKLFDERNGIRSMLNNLAGDPLFGTVKLIKSERGPVPRLCDKMIPPQ